jgi:hypothetical protein
MPRRPAGFFLGDTAFLSDGKFRKLARRLPDPDDFNSAVGAYWIALAAARRNGRPELDLDTETGSRFLPDLLAVGLLVGGGFRPEPFDAWAPKSPQVIAGQARAAQGKRDEKGRLLPSDTSTLGPLDDAGTPLGPEHETPSSALDPLEKLVQPSTPLLSTPLPSTEEGGPGGETDDDLWRLYTGLTRAASLKPAAVEWLDRIERTYGLVPAAKALREEHARDGNPGTLLSRVNAILEREAKKAELAQVEDKRSDKIRSQVLARAIEHYRFTGKWDEGLYGPLPAGVEVVS